MINKVKKTKLTGEKSIEGFDDELEIWGSAHVVLNEASKKIEKESRPAYDKVKARMSKEDPEQTVKNVLYDGNRIKATLNRYYKGEQTVKVVDTKKLSMDYPIKEILVDLYETSQLEIPAEGLEEILERKKKEKEKKGEDVSGIDIKKYLTTKKIEGTLGEMLIIGRKEIPSEDELLLVRRKDYEILQHYASIAMEYGKLLNSAKSLKPIDLEKIKVL